MEQSKIIDTLETYHATTFKCICKPRKSDACEHMRCQLPNGFCATKEVEDANSCGTVVQLLKNWGCQLLIGSCATKIVVDANVVGLFKKLRLPTPKWFWCNYESRGCQLV